MLEQHTMPWNHTSSQPARKGLWLLYALITARFEFRAPLHTLRATLGTSESYVVRISLHVKMRFLKRKSGDDFELVTVNTDNLPSSAILSHTWTDGEEVAYEELVASTGKNKAGYDKIRFCGERAAAENLQYFWVDSCCIDKFSMQELQTAINSMFRWY